MADELHDAEFWLPSQFLTDDDILLDFRSGSGSTSDLVSLSTETEISDDDRLTRPFSPQSTLFGCDCNHPDSSLGSPTGPAEDGVEKKDDGGDKSDNSAAATLDLLNKAAGEVAKMKSRSDRSYTGTGFFDCSNSAKGLLCPPPALPQRTTPYFPPQFYSHPHFRHFPPHMTWGPVQVAPPPNQQQNRVTKNSTKSNGINRTLGLPPSAWPPLPAQAQAQARPQTRGVGTGVFLPRGVATSAQPKKKSDVNMMKTKNNKGSQRRNSRLTKANDEEMQLPSEWVY